MPSRFCSTCRDVIGAGGTATMCARCRALRALLARLHNPGGLRPKAPDGPGRAERVARYRDRAARRAPLFD